MQFAFDNWRARYHLLDIVPAYLCESCREEAVQYKYGHALPIRAFAGRKRLAIKYECESHQRRHQS